MDWSPRNPLQWDWGNSELFCGKAAEISRPTPQAEFSGLELGNGSSKSSISASIDSAKAGIRPVFNIEEAKGSSSQKKCFNKNDGLLRVEDNGSSPSVVTTVGSKEPLICLKLGKRTYFEDAGGRNNVKNLPSSAPLAKKAKVSQQSVQSSYCQVEGCNTDLTDGKDYHRKHRVCESHSKSPKVIVAGQERRFCQQCSRFHELSEFDQKKRSCRRRLSDHNARRRKPRPETISFSSSSLSTSFYDGRQQMNLLFSRSPYSHVRTNTMSLHEGSYGFKITETTGSWMKSMGIDGQLHFPSLELSNNITTLRPDIDGLLPFKGTPAEVLNQGVEAPVAAPNLNGAGDLRCALSLLSTDSSWGSTDLGLTSHDQLASANHSTSLTQHPALHVVGSASGFWQDEPPPLPSQERVVAFGHQSVNSGPFENNTFFDSSQIPWCPVCGRIKAAL